MSVTARPATPVDNDDRQPVPPRPGRGSRHNLTSRIVLTAVSVVVAMIFLLPALWMLIGSLRTNIDLAGSMSTLSWSLFIPAKLTLENYVALLTTTTFGLSLINSAIVCLVSVAVGLVISAAAAYPLAVYRFRGRNLIFAVIVISFMVPFEAIAIPLSQQFISWGLGNTLIGLILPGLGNGLAIFNLRQFFLGIPNSYREAAMIDGASEPRVLFSLYVPMSGPALTTSALLIFLGQWSAYLWPLLLNSDDTKQLAPVALASTFGEHGADFAENFAGAILLALVPALCILVLQRFFGSLSIGSGEK